MKIESEVDQRLRTNFSIWGDGALVMDTRLCVLTWDDLMREILGEVYNLAYVMHPRSTKMYCTL